MPKEGQTPDNSKAEKPAKKISGGQSGTDTDRFTKPPNRVHVFKRKKPPTDSPESDSEEKQCATFRAPIPFKEGLIHLASQIEKGKWALYDAVIKAEDLKVMIETAQQTRKFIFQKRR